MTAVQTLAAQVASQMPLPPILVRTTAPGRPLQWIDPTPKTADENGHAWMFSVDEPLTGPAYCVLCCEDHGGIDSFAPCHEADRLAAYNVERTAWIDTNRVNPEDIR